MGSNGGQGTTVWSLGGSLTATKKWGKRGKKFITKKIQKKWEHMLQVAKAQRKKIVKIKEKTKQYIKFTQKGAKQIVTTYINNLKQDVNTATAIGDEITAHIWDFCIYPVEEVYQLWKELRLIREVQKEWKEVVIQGIGMPTHLIPPHPPITPKLHSKRWIQHRSRSYWVCCTETVVFSSKCGYKKYWGKVAVKRNLWHKEKWHKPAAYTMTESPEMPTTKKNKEQKTGGKGKRNNKQAQKSKGPQPNKVIKIMRGGGQMREKKTHHKHTEQTTKNTHGHKEQTYTGI